MTRQRLSPQQRILRARLAATVLHSRRDSRELTAAARAAFLGRFETEVDPERRLPVAERERRATLARRAYFVRLAYSSSKARSARSRRRVRGRWAGGD